ncbi:MAG TPA: PspC domain-containing protein [Bacteroides togonis]|jgi:phage shock protein C|uniref:PspC domain-containing protein n=3 Tax=Bacteroidaceae TaxID=815 RepID=A0AA41D8V8_9BACT|nr:MULTISPECIES: PspC domain-containing protein [Bacteroidaceae]CCX62068.1 pspC domain protein [Bacteroides sp. CAG:598]CCZ47695.1 pspC domain protein [Bacteroides sp. CAG:661]HIZ91474.1 PspC domain-containing protein [Candidatus Bacteroides merdavium]MBM6857104.1 PspC domain-containing protein [Caecibacteroides pullorum]MBV8038857.1 PspC domain-containing protein [Caecibacteroides pullorum]
MEAEKKLRRPRTGRMLAGVCAGIANYFALDPTVIRVVYTLATVFTAFSGVIIYFLLMLIIPEEENRYFQD